MRKFLSLLLAVCMVLSMTIVVSAEEKQTTVRYVGEQENYYEVTVPSLMAPGETKSVLLEGYWDSTEQVVVSAPDYVTLTNNLDGEMEDLKIEFDGFNQVGDNRNIISEEKDISVSEFNGDVFFGTWEGVIIYSVVMIDTDAPVIKTFTVKDMSSQEEEFSYEEGMKWYQWIDSDYNTVDMYVGQYIDDEAILYGGSYIILEEGNHRVSPVDIITDGVYILE